MLLEIETLPRLDKRKVKKMPASATGGGRRSDRFAPRRGAEASPAVKSGGVLLPAFFSGWHTLE